MNAFVLALIAALTWGTSTLLEKIGLAAADPLAGVWARCVGVFAGGALMTFLVPQLPAKIHQMGWRSFAWLAAAGCCASVLGQIFFYRALKMGEVGRVAPVAGAWPLFAFFWSMLFLKEDPSPRKICGVLLVVLGVALLK